MSVAYVDTSALVKLAVAEPESASLQDWLARATTVVVATSVLARVELTRAARRHSDAAASAAAEVLARTDLILMTAEVLADAAVLEPPGLRTLDAIHLATARRVGTSLSAFVAYDTRLLAAATAAGLPVVSPR